MAIRMQQRRGTAAQWTSADPILGPGEIGVETDTNQFKLGDGTSVWSDLSYFKNLEDLGGSLDDYILLTQKGAASGVATLDSNGQIPISQLASLINDAPAALDTLGEIADLADAISTAITNHTNDTTTVHGIADTAALATKAYADQKDADKYQDALSAIEVHRVDTTDVHGIVDTSLLLTTSDKTNLEGLISDAVDLASSDLSDHNGNTLSVHGITNTALLETQTGAQTKADAAESAASAALGTHNSATTSVHGISNTANLVYTNDSRLTDTRTPSDLSVTAGKIATDAVTTAKILDENVTTAKIADASITTAKIADSAITSAKIADATIVDADISASAAIAQSKISGLTSDLALKAPLASPTFTGTVVLPTVTAGGSIVPGTDNVYDLGSPTSMWKDIYVGPGSLYVNGQKVIQDETGGIVVSADINENLGLRTSGSGNIEFDPTGTGSINIKGPVVVEAGANFSSADGNGIAFSNGLKSDSLVSKSTNTDLSLSGNGTGKVYLNDNAEVNGNLIVGGNLTVSGTTTSINTETISLADNIIDLNSNFTTGAPTENSGIRVVRGDSNAVQVRWNESTDKWEFTNDGTNYSSLAGIESPTFTGTVSGITKSMVNLGSVDNTSDASKPVSTATQAALDLKANLASPTIATPTITGALTLSASGVAFTDGTQTKAGVPSITTIATALAAGAQTIAAGQQDKFIPLTGAVVITLPASGYSTGQSIDFYQESSTGARFESTNGVVGTPGLKFRATSSVCTAMKTASGWLVFGDLSA